MNTHKYYETARRAYAWTSYRPDERAAGECRYYDDITQEFADNPLVRAKFERLFLLSLAAKSRCASSAITGGSGFNVEKARRASAREHAISGEMLAYIDRVRAAIKKEAHYAAHPEARPIAASDADAVERLREKLATQEALQAKMVAANKLIRKGNKPALVTLCGEAEATELLKLGRFQGQGFASYELTNNNAKIKATRERIIEIEKRKATAPKDIIINGVRVLENTEAMRLQLFFEGKPPAPMIALLKSHAFKWSPSNMAWQRQLTNNCIYAFNHWVLPALKQEQAQ